MLPQVKLSGKQGFTKCFGCGQDNPIGLKLKPRREGNTVKAEFIPGELHQGWPGMVHGGILLTLLDEVMAYTAYFEGLNCLTGRTQVRLRRPVAIGEPLYLTASITRRTRKLLETKATATLRDGTPVAEGTALMYIAPEA